jgi:hypothetical protein
MSLTQAWYVSTPRWTCLLCVSPDGRITTCAPLLWRRWRGQRWTDFLDTQHGTWGAGLRVVELEP